MEAAGVSARTGGSLQLGSSCRMSLMDLHLERIAAFSS